MNNNYPKCGDCDRGMIANRAWRRLTAEEKAEHQADGRTVHGGHGLCGRCYLRARRRALNPENYVEPNPVPRAVVLEEWLWLANPWRTDRHNAEQLAPRLGMNTLALIRTVEQLRKQGLLDPPKRWAA